MTAPAGGGNTGHRQFLSTTGNRKAHFEFAFGRLEHLPSCNSGGPVVERLVALEEDGGLEETLAILIGARIAPSRLCRRCFGARLVRIHTQRWAEVQRQRIYGEPEKQATLC